MARRPHVDRQTLGSFEVAQQSEHHLHLVVLPGCASVMGVVGTSVFSWICLREFGTAAIPLVALPLLILVFCLYLSIVRRSIEVSAGRIVIHYRFFWLRWQRQLLVPDPNLVGVRWISDPMYGICVGSPLQFRWLPGCGTKREVVTAANLIRRHLAGTDEQVVPQGFDQLLRESRLGRLYQVVIAIAFIACGVVLAVNGIPDVIRGHQSRHWPTVQGNVISSSLNISNSNYRADVIYEYEVDGGRYTGNVVSVGAIGWNTPGPAQRTVDRYRPGNEVQVYYRPQRPDDSILEPGIPMTAMVYPLAAVLCAGLGTMVLWLSRRRLRDGSLAAAVGEQLQDSRRTYARD
jgi:hypothetical protein